MDRTGIAVLGTGSVGTRHLSAFQDAGARAVAVPLRPERRAELAAAGFETAESLAAARALGASACVVATDTCRHVADALAAVAAGFDVLVEKPLSRDAESARALLGAARAGGRRVRVACVLRFYRALERFRERLPEAGSRHSVRIECRSYLPDWRPGRPYKESYSARADEGGVLRDLIHEVDYAGWLFGWPDAVSARLGSTGRLGIASEEWAELAWGDGGGAVTVGLDYLTRSPRRGARVLGADGALELDLVAGTTSFTTPAGEARTEPAPQPRDEAFRSQARAFLSLLKGGSDERLATLEDGWRAVAVCDAARRSSASGRTEEVGGL
ncbi:MAG: Gfo/Idh/MocA family oxidoreductase [Elusimicrobia bacterium]|nr:Gfo/Idh/MocA family oxidoreductase [Elusimicrobiota bacterium]